MRNFANKCKQKLGFFMSILMMLILLTSCKIDLSGKLDIYEYGYFQYVIGGKTGRYPKNDNDRAIAIVGLTDSGQEQESLGIPKTINNIDVLYLGYKEGSYMWSGNYHIKSPNLKKIYLYNSAIIFVEGSLNYEIKVMLCDYKPSLNFDAYHNVYVYRDIFEISKNEYQYFEEEYRILGQNIIPANITFLNNYSNEINQGYYMLDNIDGESKIPLLTNPERLGFTFTGWYTEEECVTKWNFEDTLEIEEGNDFKLYAGWEEIN